MRLKELREKIRSRATDEFRAGRLTQGQFDLCEAVADNDLSLQKLNEYLKDAANFWDRFITGWRGISSNHHDNSALTTIGDCR
jgi:hypothetical protein